MRKKKKETFGPFSIRKRPFKISKMIKQTYAEIVTPKLLQGAIENNEFTGFLQDYHVLHCLLRKYQPESVFEIGTNMGTGTNIICNAVPKAKVYSLDLPTELAHISLQHPISEGKGDNVGSKCKFPFTQLRGDSLTFYYSDYPCEAYFIDGEHDFDHPYYETDSIIGDAKPKLIIWHDSDIPEVWEAITEAIDSNYTLYRVTDTRIAYATRNDNS
jgi:hypothetical protein